MRCVKYAATFPTHLRENPGCGGDRAAAKSLEGLWRVSEGSLEPLEGLWRASGSSGASGGPLGDLFDTECIILLEIVQGDLFISPFVAKTIFFRQNVLKNKIIQEDLFISWSQKNVHFGNFFVKKIKLSRKTSSCPGVKKMCILVTFL